MSTDPRREAAINRLKAKRDFMANVLSYVVINAIFVAIWAVGSRGFFWPIFTLGFWGLGLLLHAYSAFARPITEDDIRREIDKGGDASY